MKLPLVFFLFIMAAAPANAITFILKADGIVESGLDGAGFFLRPGSSLVGQPFNLKLFIDSNRGTTVGSDSSFVIKGSDDGDESPVYRIVLNIGNSDIRYRTSYYSYYNTSEYSKTSIEAFIIDKGVFEQNLIRYGTISLSASDLLNDPLGFPFNLEPYEFTVADGSNVLDVNYRIIDAYGQQLIQTSAYGNLSNISVSRVPEVSIWVLMIVGFGLTGLMKRTTRKNSGQYAII